MMPSFIGSLDDAERAGLRCLKCAWCDGWVWWPPDDELTDETRAAGLVFHSFGWCADLEHEARRKERT
jgi:hypothetical protein